MMQTGSARIDSPALKAVGRVMSLATAAAVVLAMGLPASMPAQASDTKPEPLHRVSLRAPGPQGLPGRTTIAPQALA